MHTKKYLLPLLLLSCCIGQAFGQLFQFNQVSLFESPFTVAANAGQSREVQFFDADNDGDDDFYLFGESTGDPIPIYINQTFNGKTTFIKDVSFFPELNDYFVATAIGDYNNDKVPDIFLFGLDSVVHLVPQNGKAQLAECPQALADKIEALTFCFVDLNNDGLEDCVYMNIGSDTLSFLYNVGTLAKPEYQEATDLNHYFAQITNKAEGILAVSAADSDGDQKPDLFITTRTYSFSDHILTFQNVGTTGNAKFKQLSGNDNQLSSFDANSNIMFADIDGDNDLDCFFSLFTQADLCFLKNIGTNTDPLYIKIEKQASPFYGSGIFNSQYSPVFVDLNNDLRMDFCSRDISGASYFFENTGQGDNLSYTERYSSYNPLPIKLNDAPVFIDLDNDGDLDILGAQCYRNIGTVTKPGYAPFPTANNPVAGLSISQYYTITGNLNNDRFNDFLVYDNYYKDNQTLVQLYLNNGSTESPGFDLSSFVLNTEEVEGMMLFDVNGDNLDDLLWYDLTNIYYLLNLGTGADPLFQGAETPEQAEVFFAFPGNGQEFPYYQGVRVGDITGDGTPDILYGNRDEIYFYKGTNTQFVVDRSVRINSASDWASIEAAFSGTAKLTDLTVVYWEDGLVEKDEEYIAETVLPGATYSFELYPYGISNSLYLYYKAFDSDNDVYLRSKTYHIKLNTPPTSRDTLFNIHQGFPHYFKLDDFYFTDADNDELYDIEIFLEPQNGTLMLAGEPLNIEQVPILPAQSIPMLTYYPNDTLTGIRADSMAFQVYDGRDVSPDVNFVVFSIKAFNTGPASQNKTYVLAQDQKHYFTDLPYADIENDSLQGILLLSLPTNGYLYHNDQLLLKADTLLQKPELLAFVPEPQAIGSPYAQFTYRVVDATGRKSDQAYTATMQVLATSNSPATNNRHAKIYLQANTLYLKNAMGANLTLYNCQGQYLYSTQIQDNNETRNLSQLPVGVYLAQLQTGTQKQTIRLLLGN